MPKHALGRRQVDLLLLMLGGHVRDGASDHVNHVGQAPALRGAEQVAVYAQRADGLSDPPPLDDVAMHVHGADLSCLFVVADDDDVRIRCH